jgi:hypothetical protein
MSNTWKEQVDSPWQTTWEGPHGGSKAHIYGIVPGFFLTAYVLGARREEPVSARSIVIEPRCGGLQWAKGTAGTEFGPVDMKWNRKADGTLALACAVPPTCTATLRLYRPGDQTHIELDGKRRQGRIDGRFLQFVLAPGRHFARL